MSVAPATTAAVLVAISGVVQDPSTYSIVGTTLTFSQAPPSATANISTRYLGIPSTGVTSTAYRTVTEFTATAAQTTFTPPSFTPGFVNVYRNGVLLGSADYVASSGTAVVLNSAATLGDLITVESFLVSSILNVTSSVNQILTTPTISSPTITTPTITTPTITSPIFSGNVGIGTTSPNAKLEVVGVFRSGTSAVNIDLYSDAGGVYFESTGTSSANRAIRLQSQDGSNNYAQLYVHGGSNYVAFMTNTTERMRVDSSGNVLIGATTNPAGGKLYVYGNGGVVVSNTSGNYRQMYMDSTALGFFNGSNQATLSSAGTWTNASDARLKNSIVDIKYGLSTVLNTQPRSYKMNDLEGEYIGFVAQELQTVIPEVVSGDPEKQLGVDYGSLVAVAFKAIQELSAEVTALKAKVGA
jgi:hypothetical protein